jgi:hypothetical protein
MEADLGDAGDSPAHEIFDAGLCGRSHCNGIAVAPEPGSDPEDVYVGYLLRRLHRHASYLPAPIPEVRLSLVERRVSV